MKKRILLIGYNFYPELTGIGKYSGEMMHWLAERGHDCTVLTTYPYYPYWKTQEPYYKNRFWYQTEVEHFASGGKLTIHRCPMYVPAVPTGMKRMLLDASFLISAFLRLLLLLPSRKFDLTVAIAPSFQIGLLGVLYKFMRNNKLIYHIQDMQIEAAQELNMINNLTIIKFLFKVEAFIFNKSDFISSISFGMINKIKEKARKKVWLFPNWVDTKLFHSLENRNEIKEKFGFAQTDKIILYSGAIGEKQGLESVIYAASEFSEEYKFIICGSGPYKSKLEQLACIIKTQNVFFMPLQPNEKFNSFLNIADVHLVIQKIHAGDLVMPSKLTTILAVDGVAVITANANTSLYNVVQEHKLGILVEAENQQALVEGIRQALMESTRVDIICNAKSYTQDYLSIEKIMHEFELLFL